MNGTAVQSAQCDDVVINEKLCRFDMRTKQSCPPHKVSNGKEICINFNERLPSPVLFSRRRSGQHLSKNIAKWCRWRFIICLFVSHWLETSLSNIVKAKQKKKKVTGEHRKEGVSDGKGEWGETRTIWQRYFNIGKQQIPFFTVVDTIRSCSPTPLLNPSTNKELLNLCDVLNTVVTGIASCCLSVDQLNTVAKNCPAITWPQVKQMMRRLAPI